MTHFLEGGRKESSKIYNTVLALRGEDRKRRLKGEGERNSVDLWRAFDCRKTLRRSARGCQRGLLREGAEPGGSQVRGGGNTRRQQQRSDLRRGGEFLRDRRFEKRPERRAGVPMPRPSTNGRGGVSLQRPKLEYRLRGANWPKED